MKTPLHHYVNRHKNEWLLNKAMDYNVAIQ